MRQAPKVGGSNPPPATKRFKRKDVNLRALVKGFILDKRVEGLSLRTIDFYKAKLIRVYIRSTTLFSRLKITEHLFSGIIY